MPLQLDNSVFEEELLRLRNQLGRYLSDDRAWGTTNRSKWFLSWYRGNQSWLRGSSLDRVNRLPQGRAKPPSEVSPLDHYGKSVISNLLTNGSVNKFV
jgi:hypothetical protein